MRKSNRLGLILTAASLITVIVDADARPSLGGGGGGGGRPSINRGGGGGGGGPRPNLGGGNRPVSRPSTPSINRPTAGNRPNSPNIGQRPSVGNRPTTRPEIGNRPGLGNIKPNNPPGNRPTTLPSNIGSGGGNRPNLRPPGQLPPTQRPVTLPGKPGINPPGGNRPGIGGDRPTTLPGRPGVGGDRPGVGGNRPGIGGDRPTTLPGRPGVGGDRPGIGGNRPGIGGDRPTTLPGRPGIGGNRPGIGGDRPGIGGDRPGIGGNRPGIRPPDRPIIGGGGDRPGIGNRPDRPIIGGNRPNIGNGNINVNRPNIGNGNINVNRPNIGNGNINVNRPVIGGGNNVNINRPNYGNNIYGRPGWGIDPGFARPHWGNYWQGHCVNPHYNGWYHGCWHGHWSNYWYVPLAVGATAWSLNAFTSSWGYGPTYVNPYYTAAPSAVVAPYDYSQPVVVNNYVSADADSDAAPQPPAPTPEEQAALDSFDEARAAFQNGEYSKALAKVTVALQKNPQDPILHEFRALCLFAVGEYKEAAATLNSLLTSAPGMDWTTLSGLYGNVDDYSKQLRRLEEFAKTNEKDASSRFVLAYHYLVLGHTDEAIKMLQRVVELQPSDVTAKRMLASLSPPKEDATTPPPAPADAPDAPETDLVGSWKAQAGESLIELTITEDSKFTWKATMPKQPPKELQGSLGVSGDSLSLETEKAGSMVGQVKSGGADKFTFRMQGMLPTDPGLVFERVK